MLYDTGSSNLVLCDYLQKWDAARSGKQVQEGGDVWLSHVDVWQKPTQYCKTVALQLKINKQIAPGKNKPCRILCPSTPIDSAPVS